MPNNTLETLETVLAVYFFLLHKWKVTDEDIIDLIIETGLLNGVEKEDSVLVLKKAQLITNDENYFGKTMDRMDQISLPIREKMVSDIARVLIHNLDEDETEDDLSAGIDFVFEMASDSGVSREVASEIVRVTRIQKRKIV
jgi:hypothetical protein